MTEIHGPSQAGVNVLDGRRKLRVVGNVLQSSDQTIEITICLSETKALDAELVESIKVRDGLVS